MRVFGPTLILALSLALTIGCSVALDFDRGFPGRGDDIGDIFGTGVLPPPRPAETPDVGLCDPLCSRWFNCLAQGDLCHRFTLTAPEDEDELILLCSLRCERSGTVVQSQVDALADPAQCERAGRRFLALDPAFDDACSFYKNECDSICREWPETFTACQGHRPEECDALCLDTPLSFWTCFEDVTASRRASCDDIGRCAGLEP